MRYFLRPYRSDDFQAIYALDGMCFGPRFRFSKATMRNVTGDRQALLRVACDVAPTGGEVIVGFCAATVENRGVLRVGYITTLGVAPASQGRGIGRALLAAAERDLAGKGLREVQLHVFAGNRAAIGLYEATGYVLLHREANFYGVGDDALAYGKTLPE